MISVQALDYPGIENSIPVIYMLLLKGEVVYVGQSLNLKIRVYTHKNNGVDFDEVSFRHVDKSDMNNEEALDIAKYNPKLNATMPKNDHFRPISSIAIESKELLFNGLLELPIIFSGEIRRNGKRTYYVDVLYARKLLEHIEKSIKEFVALGEDKDE